MIQIFNFEQDHSEGYKVVSIGKSYYLYLHSLAKVNWSSNSMYVGNVPVPLYLCVLFVILDTLEDQQKQDGSAYIQVVKHIL